MKATEHHDAQRVLDADVAESPDSILASVIAGGRLLERSGDAEGAVQHYFLAADHMRRLGDIASAAAVECIGAQLLFQIGGHDEAVERLQTLIDATTPLQNVDLQVNLLSALGEAERTQGNYRNALVVLERALPLAESIAYDAVCTVLVRLGETQKACGDIPEAVRTLRRAAEVALLIEPNPALPCPRCDAFIDFGNILRSTGKPAEALVWHKLARDESVASEDPLAIANAYRELGNTYLYLDQNASALEALLLAVRIGESARASISQANTLQLLAIALGRRGNLNSAIERLDQAEDIARRSGEGVTAASIAMTRAVTLIALDRIDEARTVIDAAIDGVRELANPGSLANLRRVSAHIEFASSNWSSCRENVRISLQHLAGLLEEETSPHAIGTVLGNHISVFCQGVQACERDWIQTRDRRVLEEAVEFADAAKCAAIREGMRRHRLGLERTTTSVHWRAAPSDWRSLFVEERRPGRRAAADGRAPARGAQNRTPAKRETTPVIESSGLREREKNRFCEPVSFDALEEVVPDADTVLLNLFLDEDDLLILPIRRGGSSRLEVIRGPDGFIRRKGVLGELTTVMAKWRASIDKTVESGRREDVTGLAEKIYELVGIGVVLGTLGVDDTTLRRKHIIVVPDGILASVPMHVAADPATGRRLIERVASMRYSLSLRTLQMQQAIENERAATERNVPGLRGVGFAWPDRTGTFLRGVIAEVGALIEETSADSWWICGEVGPPEVVASRESFRVAHRTGNLGWFMGHGTACAEDHVPLEDGSTAVVYEPSLVLSNGELSMSRMVAHSYDFSNWRLFHIGACLMGRLDTLGKSKELLGYVATLTMLHCRRVTSALWELDDGAAVLFSREFIRRLRAQVYAAVPLGPHAFAVAFREAVLALREADQGRFAHEFFWAPFVFYGLG